MQKKQNTRRSLSDSVHKIYRAGMLVIAGFILGFDTEVRHVAATLSRPSLDKSASSDPQPQRIYGIARHDLATLWQIVRWLALRQPRALWLFASLLRDCLVKYPASVPAVCTLTAMYLHVGPFFSSFVTSALDRHIAEIDSGGWQSPLAGAGELSRYQKAHAQKTRPRAGALAH